MQVTIDRFEEGIAVVQTPDGGVYRLDRALVPPEAREGDVLVIGLDPDATQVYGAADEGRLGGLSLAVAVLRRRAAE